MEQWMLRIKRWFGLNLTFQNRAQHLRNLISHEIRMNALYGGDALVETLLQIDAIARQTHVDREERLEKCKFVLLTSHTGWVSSPVGHHS